MEYRSEQAWGTLPLVHVAVGLAALGAVTAGLLVGPRPPGGIAPSAELPAEDGRPGGR